MKIKIIYYKLRKWTLIIGVMISSPIFLYLIARRKKTLNNDKLRILVIPNITRIGDLVCETPVFRAIKEKYPNCYLAVLTQNKNTGIIKNNPRIDEIIDYKSKDLVKRVLPLIKKKKFNWSFNLVGTPQGSLVSFIGLIPNRVTLTRAKKPITEVFTDWLNNYKFFYKDHTYLPSFYTRLLKPLNIEPIEERQEIKEVFTTPETEKKVEEWLKEKNISSNDKLVGISITAGNKIKEWGDDNFKRVAEYVVRNHNSKILFLGGKKDDSRIENLIKNLDKSKFIKATDFRIKELPSLIKRLSLYIAVDTGPIYIAHALKTPLIDICGPCDPREQPPKDDISIQILPDGNLEPSSFVLKRAGKPEEHQKALVNTGVDKVIESIDKIIK